MEPYKILVKPVFAGRSDGRADNEYGTLSIGDRIPGLGTVSDIVDLGYGLLLIQLGVYVELRVSVSTLLYVEPTRAERDEHYQQTAANETLRALGSRLRGM